MLADGKAVCDCFVDEEATGSFYLLEPLECPTEEEINVACLFPLVSPNAGLPQPISCQAGAATGAPTGHFGCTAEFLCAEQTFGIDCSEDSGPPRCECLVDGVRVGGFRVHDGFCPAGSTAGLARINAGCGWALSADF